MGIIDDPAVDTTLKPADIPRQKGLLPRDEEDKDPTTTPRVFGTPVKQKQPPKNSTQNSLEKL